MKEYFSLLLLASVCLLFLNSLSSVSAAKCARNVNEVVVTTKLGKIRGACNQVSVEGRQEKKNVDMYTWMGIPYAQPPVNERRFRPPEPMKAWPNMIDARKLGNSCLQKTSVKGSNPTGYAAYEMWSNAASVPSEDCLYLNVFMQADLFQKKDSKPPVLVFFQGVGYTKGSSVLDIYDPSVFSALSGIVVVTFNYRLGLFGFLHLNDSKTNETIEGNQALLDQYMALKWVNENIESFGGDPSKVTVAGQGVGGVLASFHLFYKPSSLLYRNMILQSASPLNPVFSPISSEEATKRTKAMLTLFNCTNTTSLKCIQSLDANRLLDASTHLFNNMMLKGNRDASSYLRSAFKPVIDGRFFKSSPRELLYSNQYKSCNILTGFTANEGSINLPRTGLFAGAKLEEIAKRRHFNYTELIGFLVKYYQFYPDWPYRNNKLFLNSVLNEYTSLTTDTYKNPTSSHLLKANYLSTLERIIGDELVVCPAKMFADVLSKRSKVYLYRFDHRVSTSLWPSWFGAVHGDELSMTLAHTLAMPPFSSFNVSRNPWLPTSPKTYTEEEKTLGKEIFGLWITFIRTDNPNAQNRYRARNSDKDWPEYTLPQSPAPKQPKKNSPPPKDSLFYVLKVNGTKIARNVKNDECNLWQNFIPSIQKEIIKQRNEVTISQDAKDNKTETTKQETTKTTTTQAKTVVSSTTVIPKETAAQNKTTSANQTVETTTTLDPFDF